MDKYQESRKKHFKIRVFVCNHCGFLIISNTRTNDVMCPYCKTSESAKKLTSISMRRTDITAHNTSKKYEGKYGTDKRTA